MAQREGSPQVELEQYRDYLKQLANARLGKHYQRRVDASDVVQATMLEAHRNRELFRGDDSAALACWLRSMLANNITDAVREATREKRDVRRERSLEPLVGAETSRAQNGLAAEQTSPSQHVARDEMCLALANAIRCLPADQGEAVVLHHLQGMSLRELAQHFSRSESAVAGLLYRGLQQLRDFLGGHDQKK